MDVANAVVVVTGGAHGIGAALSRGFSEHQADHVAVLDIDEPAAATVAADVGGSSHFCDVSVEASIESALDAVLNEQGRIDILVSNAGVTSSGGLELPDTEWQRQWDINVMSHVLGRSQSAAALP